MKKIVFAVFIVLAASTAAFAMKVENLPSISFIPLNSDFHIGIVNGIGNGLNIGINALVPLGDFGAGLEVEQIMSDINYSATINATRFGLIASLLLYNSIKLNYHMGNFNFMPSQAINFIDATGGNYILAEATNYKGQYWGISADYPAFDFIFTLKFTNNAIQDKGTVREIDLNIGRSLLNFRQSSRVAAESGTSNTATEVNSTATQEGASQKMDLNTRKSLRNYLQNGK